MPIGSISWHDAIRYCNKLSEDENLPSCYTISNQEILWENLYKCIGFRLPTYEEYTLIWTEILPDFKRDGFSHYSWFRTANLTEPQLPAQLHPDKLGLYDIAGNMWEWAWDEYNGIEQPSRFPLTNSLRSWRHRALFGGSWLTMAPQLSEAPMSHLAPQSRGFDIGFRVVRSINVVQDTP